MLAQLWRKIGRFLILKLADLWCFVDAWIAISRIFSIL
jgi:hypothetical protein